MQELVHNAEATFIKELIKVFLAFVNIDAFYMVIQNIPSSPFFFQYPCALISVLGWTAEVV